MTNIIPYRSLVFD